MRHFLTMITTFICTLILAQPMIEGTWQVTDTDKQLTFESDYTFEFKSPTKTLIGVYTLESMSDFVANLTMVYDNGPTLDYRVTKTNANELIMLSKAKNQKLVLMRKDAINTEVTEKKDEEVAASDALSANQKAPRSSFISKLNKRSFVISPSFGVGNYLSNKPVFYDNGSLPITLTLETGVGYNIGVGSTFGYRQWSIPESSIRSEVYTFAPRVAYHVPIIDRLDAYAGVAGVLRYGRTTNANARGKLTVGASPVIGVNYYLTSFLAAKAEFAMDATSLANFGISLKF